MREGSSPSHSYASRSADRPALYFLGVPDPRLRILTRAADKTGSGLAAKQVNAQIDAGNDEHDQTPETQDDSSPDGPPTVIIAMNQHRDSESHEIRNHVALRLG